MDLVNGWTEQEQRQAEKQEQPFIVVAAVENDASSSDPNEAFIPTKEPAQQGSSSHRPAFNLLSKDDLLREQATDFEVVEAAEDANAPGDGQQVFKEWSWLQSAGDCLMSNVYLHT